MNEQDIEADEIERKVHDLAEAMNRVRSAQADRDDVVVDMKDAKFKRLTLLAEDIAPVFDDIPEDNEQFEFAITNGETPRLWVDMTSFVRMAADGREYEFVKDTRLGRIVLGRNENRETIGKRITDYVAERLLERERMIEGDWISAKALIESRAEKQSSEISEDDNEEEKAPDTAPRQAQPGSSAWLVWLLVILALGCAVVLGAVATDQLEPMLTRLQELTGWTTQ
ncbi:MAG: hypothetical protein AAF423_06895 [Pseudomonadota bacterium]